MGKLKPVAYLKCPPKNHPSTDQPHNIVMTMKKRIIKNIEMKEKNTINAKKAKKKLKKKKKMHQKNNNRSINYKAEAE